MKNSSAPVYLSMLVLQALLVASTMCVGTCAAASESLKKPNKAPLPPRLQSLFKQTKTVCFGRFLIDIPATATPVFGGAEVGPEIFYLRGESGKIAQYVAKDLVEVETSRRYFTEGDSARLPMFGKVIDGIVPGQKITFDSKDQVGYYINAYVPHGPDLFVLHFSSVMHEDYDVDDFNVVANRIRLRADEEIPTGPGTCINGGFLPMVLEYERVRFGVRLMEFSDVHLSIEVHKNHDRLDEHERLELRLKGAAESAKQSGLGNVYARIKTLRRGTRQMGPWKGYEMVARKPAYKKDTDAHEFLFESLGAVHDPLLPRIDIRLETGVKDNRTAGAKPSLTDVEAVALWDRLIGTIRVRPVGGKKAPKVVPAAAGR